LQSDGTRSFRYLSQRGLGNWSIGRIDQHGYPNSLGHQIVKQPKSLGPKLADELIYPRGVATRPRKAGDKT
jgi:hypothetical protein